MENGVHRKSISIRVLFGLTLSTPTPQLISMKAQVQILALTPTSYVMERELFYLLNLSAVIYKCCHT